jgi:hypothetical protein
MHNLRKNRQAPWEHKGLRAINLSTIDSKPRKILKRRVNLEARAQELHSRTESVSGRIHWLAGTFDGTNSIRPACSRFVKNSETSVRQRSSSTSK